VDGSMTTSDGKETRFTGKIYSPNASGDPRFYSRSAITCRLLSLKG
jgi:hypothetical protein